MKIWTVGQFKERVIVGGQEIAAWEFQGVFESRELARAACRDENYFFFVSELNEQLPHETTVPVGEYPLLEEAQAK